MCGRFALVTTEKKLRMQFDIDELPGIFPRFNIAPTQNILFLMPNMAHRLSGVMLRWGLVPFFSKEPRAGLSLINARAETLADKAIFRKSLKCQRGIIIMSGFYEWKVSPEGKQPYYIHKKTDELLAIAGIWDMWESGEGEVIRSCCLVTCPANNTLEPIHSRMPVILNREQQALWLDQNIHDHKQLLPLLTPWSGSDLLAYPVTKQVNNWRYNEVDCIKQIRM